MNHPTHDQIRTLIENSLIEETRLDRTTQASVDAHLATCADCRSFAELVSHLKSSSWNPNPNRVLTNAERASLLHKIMPQTQKPHFSAVPEAGKRRSMPLLPKPWAAAGVAALGVIVIGLFFALLQGSGTRSGDEDKPSVKVAAVDSETSVTLPPVESNSLVLPPPGLIYRHDNGHWRVDDEGNAQRLTDDGPHPLFLTFSPSGTQAVQIRQHGANYWLYTFTSDGLSIEEHRFDYPRTSIIGWLDEERAIVSVQYEGVPLQDGLGHLGLLDVVQNEIQLLEPESLLQRPPQVLSDGTMVYPRDDEIVLWREDETEAISIESLDLPGELIQFALSPNGRQIVSLVEGNFDVDGWAYIKSELNGDGQQILHTTTPLSIETAFPLGITWSPDSHWVVLAPLTASLNEPLTGPQILLVSSDGSQKKKLGPGVGLFAEWINSDTVLFIMGRSESELETYLYKLSTDQKQKIDLPAEAELVQLIKPQSK